MSDLENIQGSRVYGRRQGKPLREASQARLDEMLPRLQIMLADKIDPAEWFEGDVWLEIGFGKGEHLAWQAKENPGVGILGCEPFINGVSRLIDHLAEEASENVRIFQDDARLLMEALPDQSISRAFILFPDPWPKNRHHKRRIVSAGNIRVLSRILKDGAELRIATDHKDYCRWIMSHMLKSDDFDWVADGPEDWHQRSPDWPATRYESKAAEVGRKSSYLRFIRKGRKS